MMWHLQVIMETQLAGLAAMIHAEDAQNVIFAILALWAAIGRGERWCALVTALVHVLLILL